MQSDDQIGKIAQGTPVAICKAIFCLAYFQAKSLELFLKTIIKKACSQISCESTLLSTDVMYGNSYKVR